MSGPQDCSLSSWFCLNSEFEGKKLKKYSRILFLYKFWKFFVYFFKKEGVCGSTSSAPRHLKFCMAVYIHKKNGISFAANSSQILLHLGPRLVFISRTKIPLNKTVCHINCSNDLKFNLFEEYLLGVLKYFKDCFECHNIRNVDPWEPGKIKQQWLILTFGLF